MNTTKTFSWTLRILVTTSSFIPSGRHDQSMQTKARRHSKSFFLLVINSLTQTFIVAPWKWLPILHIPVWQYDGVDYCSVNCLSICITVGDQYFTVLGAFGCSRALWIISQLKVLSRLLCYVVALNWLNFYAGGRATQLKGAAWVSSPSLRTFNSPLTQLRHSWRASYAYTSKVHHHDILECLVVGRQCAHVMERKAEVWWESGLKKNTPLRKKTLRLGRRRVDRALCWRGRFREPRCGALSACVSCREGRRVR